MPATYYAQATTVEASRFFHGVDTFGLTESEEDEDGTTCYLLTIPHPDGDLTIEEGTWVLLDEDGMYHTCPDDLFRTMFAQ